METGWIILITIVSVIAYIAIWYGTAILGAIKLDKDEDFSIICIAWPIVLPIMLLHMLLIKIFKL